MIEKVEVKLLTPLREIVIFLKYTVKIYPKRIT